MYYTHFDWKKPPTYYDAEELDTKFGPGIFEYTKFVGKCATPKEGAWSPVPAKALGKLPTGVVELAETCRQNSIDCLMLYIIL